MGSGVWALVYQVASAFVALFALLALWWKHRQGQRTLAEFQKVKAELAQALADRDKAINLLFRSKASLGREADAMREEIVHLKGRWLQQDEIDVLREHLHKIRNT